MTSQSVSLTATLMTFGMLLSGPAVAAATGPAHVLKDINPTPSSNRGSYPDTYQRLGKVALFHAMTPQTGEELWRTDGTEAGTFLVKDINPGRGNAFNYPALMAPDDPFVELGSALYFLADDGAYGLYSFELWRSDGTEAGTRMVKKIRADSASPFTAPSQGNNPVRWQHGVAGGLLYFVANDGVHGFELWRTDGTAAGTFLLKDIFPGPHGAFGDYFDSNALVGQEAGGSFFFRTGDGINRAQLWKTDGTTAGTVLIHPGADVSAPRNFTELNGNLLFTAYNGDSGSGLWRSDGTQAGTVQITAATPWPFQTFPFGLIQANGTVYFGINDGWLYRTDGTSGGTVPVRQFESEVLPLREWNGTVLFMADDGIHGRELWRSDGTAGGTVLVKDIVAGSASSSIYLRFTEAAGRLFFFGGDGSHGLELWATDATEAGTFLVKDITAGSAGSSPYDLLGVEGTLFFFLADADYPNALRLWKSDGTAAGTRAVQSPPVAARGGIGLHGNFLFGADDVIHGAEVWRSDGTDAGTTLVKDIHPSFVTDSSNTQFMGVVSVPGIGERMFFSADDVVHGTELWVSDGTASGTRLVKDIYPGALSSDPSPGIAHDGAIYFAAGDDIHGYELWRSDGTEAGTVLVDDIFPGPDSGMWYSSTFGELGDYVYFAANDGTHGRTLWKSDGTDAGTAEVARIDLSYSFRGSPTSYPIAIGGTLYFTATDPAHGIELWKSDGTEAGTLLVRDLYPGPASSSPSLFADLHGRLFMMAQDPNHGHEPWLSDGTETGTYLIKDIFPGRTASHRGFVLPVVRGDSVYFPARWEPAHGEALWKTDGTEAGTLLVKDVDTGPLTLFDGNLYFPGSLGRLWKSDGTEEGTHVVKAGLDMTADLRAVDGGIVFASTDGDHGNELWRTDGTESGTVLVQDVFPGSESSIPREFAPLGDRILFLADDEAAGAEPWFARTAILFGRPDHAIEDLKGELKLLRLPVGIETSLSAILDAAARDLSADRTVPAILSLEAFGRYLGALSPGKVSEASAADLQEFTTEIVSLLEGSL